MRKLSKKTNDLVKRANHAYNVYTTNGQEIAARAQEIYDEASPNGTTTDVAGFLQGSVDVMRKCQAEAEETDLLVLRELGEDEAALNKRDELEETSRTETTHLCDSLRGTYGESFLVELGLDVSLPSDALQLHRLLKKSHDILTDTEDPLPMPPPLNRFVPTWDRDALARSLQSIYEPLSQAVSDATRELKETQDARRKRRLALDALQRAVIALNAHFEHLARLVGRHDIADRIRPRGGRPTKSSQETEEPSPTPESQAI